VTLGCGIIAAVVAVACLGLSSSAASSANDLEARADWVETTCSVGASTVVNATVVKCTDRGSCSARHTTGGEQCCDSYTRYPLFGVETDVNYTTPSGSASGILRYPAQTVCNTVGVCQSNYQKTVPSAHLAVMAAASSVTCWYEPAVPTNVALTSGSDERESSINGKRERATTTRTVGVVVLVVALGSFFSAAANWNKKTATSAGAKQHAAQVEVTEVELAAVAIVEPRDAASAAV
jgi:hypothetical protein